MNHNYRPAGAWSRIFAALVDSLVTSPLIFLLLIPMYSKIDEYAKIAQEQMMSLGEIKLMMIIDMLWIILIVYVLNLLYSVVLAYYWNGKTVGKHLLGIRITKNDAHTKPGFWQLFVRETIFKSLWYAFLDSIAYIVDLVMINVDKDNKKLIRDYVCKTMVIDENSIYN
ncbi:RDD family protein [Mycoplasmatota bacterium WC44]